MKKIFIILFLLCSSSSVFAQPVEYDGPTRDPVVIEKLNTLVKSMYEAALAAQPKSRELSAFGESALTKNEFGFYKIDYEMPMAAAKTQAFPYAFGVTVVPLNDKIYQDKQGYFNYPMPFLGVQFAGYQIKHPLRRQFEISKHVDKMAEEMVDYQQQYMPLQLYLILEKETYQVGEPIRFKLALANVSKHNILVQSLGKETLFFTINDSFWGTDSGVIAEPKPMTQIEQLRAQQKAMIEQQRAMVAQIRAMFGQGSANNTTERTRKTRIGDQVILRSDEALTIEFTGEGYKRAQDVKIRAVYKLNFRGLKPTTTATLKIVNRPPVAEPVSAPAANAL